MKILPTKAEKKVWKKILRTPNNIVVDLVLSSVTLTVDKAAVYLVENAGEDLIVSPVDAVMKDLIRYPEENVNMKAVISILQWRI